MKRFRSLRGVSSARRPHCERGGCGPAARWPWAPPAPRGAHSRQAPCTRRQEEEGRRDRARPAETEGQPRRRSRALGWRGGVSGAEKAAPTASGTAAPLLAPPGSAPPPAPASRDPKITVQRQGRDRSLRGGASPAPYRSRPERSKSDPAAAFYTHSPRAPPQQCLLATPRPRAPPPYRPPPGPSCSPPPLARHGAARRGGPAHVTGPGGAGRAEGVGAGRGRPRDAIKTRWARGGTLSPGPGGPGAS